MSFFGFRLGFGRVVVAATWLAVSAGCAGNDSGTRPARDAGADAGRRDSGISLRDSGPPTDARATECGDSREPCCRGSTCNPGLICNAGTCTGLESCGMRDQTCCSGNSCAMGLVCQMNRCTPSTMCGAERQPCCGGTTCTAGLVCDRGMCAATSGCGAVRQPCCDGTTCASGLECRGGTCESAVACGGARQMCCAGGMCADGLECRGGTCQTPASVCGGRGQMCCAGGMCNGGLDCCGGSCTDTGTDPRHCGSCGNACARCIDGMCDDECGGDGQMCCATGTRCRTGLACMSGTCRPEGPACEPAQSSCASASECCEGLACRASPGDVMCCVEAAGTCTSDFDCCGMMFCNDAGRCACRTSGQTCVADGDCCSGLSCIDGTCSTGGTDPCTEITTCDGCMSTSSCGWCGSTNTCVNGSGAGPTVGSCDDWRWFLSECEGGSACTSASCDDCTGLIGCGWCGDSSSCEQGSSSGPSSGACSDWNWLPSECSASDPCATETTCGGCTAQPGCGFCGTTNTCQTGTGSGPSAGSCADWNWLPSECSTDACASNTTCGDCVAEFPCGFCTTTGMCQSGSSTGPSSGTCTDWEWLPSQCMPPDPCATSLTCGDCTERAGCGFCYDSFDCLSGTESGPDATSCFDWAWFTSQC